MCWSTTATSTATCGSRPAACSSTTRTPGAPSRRSGRPVTSSGGLPEDVADDLHDPAAPVLDQQRVLADPDPLVAGGRQGQVVVPRIGDEVLGPVPAAGQEVAEAPVPHIETGRPMPRVAIAVGAAVDRRIAAPLPARPVLVA